MIARPTRVAIIDDYEVVVRGLLQMIADVPELRVVELDSMVDPSVPVDIALFDSFAAEQGVGADLLRLLAHPNVAKVVVYTWNMDRALVDLARDAGVYGYISKRSGRGELIDALKRVAKGEFVFSTTEPPRRTTAGEGDWPGRAESLSAREAEVVGLIVQGLTNQQIAKRAYLSINSVKTYIRSAYRKMGVQTRSQAILWGLDHGFMPERKLTRLE